MIIDLETEATPVSQQADVCIVGSGVAGLILAHSLRRKGLQVDVLEAGGHQLANGNEPSFAVDCPSRRHTGATEGRCRVFGGTSARWGGQLLPYSQEVFRTRPEHPESGWSIGPEEIYRHADDVLKLLGVNVFTFGAAFPQQIGHRAPIIHSEDLRVRYSKWLPFSRRNLAQTVGKTLETDPNTRIHLHANAVAIEMDAAGGRVKFLRCRTRDGREMRFRARIFVLATGTIEVTRLLLCSQQGAQKGIGNTYGQVGRYFHDHLGVIVGEIETGSVRRWEHHFAPWWVGGVLQTARIEAHPRTIAARQWVDVMAGFKFVTEGTDFERFRRLLQMRQQGQLSLRRLLAFASHLPFSFDLLRLAMGAKLRKRRLVPRGARVELHISAEQLPVNSIRLAPEHDSFGMPRVIIDWRISPEELRTIHEFRKLLCKLWQPAWGEITWRELGDPEAYLPHIRDTFHMMGGARMGTDEHSSVVDPNLKVHGVENLYIASCATYPSGGSSNPTFTLTCLCLRLAETLGRSIRE